MIEIIWKDVPGYEGLYQVANNGTVKSFHNAGTDILNPFTNNKGYKVIALKGRGKAKTVRIHRIVASAFLGESDLQINHIDGNPSNNHANNLEYVSSRENNTHNKTTSTGAFRRKDGRFNSTIRLDGKCCHIGVYDHEEQAHHAYKKVLKFMGLENKYAKIILQSASKPITQDPRPQD